MALLAEQLAMNRQGYGAALRDRPRFDLGERDLLVDRLTAVALTQQPSIA